MTWSEISLLRRSNSVETLAEYAAAADAPGAVGEVWAEKGDAPAAIAAADRQVSRMYLSSYAYHAQIEPMAAVADVDADGQGGEVWAGTQTQSWTTCTAAETLGIPIEAVRLNMMTMGGGFGRRTALMQNYVRDAVLCSKALSRPVKVIWPREDDVKQGTFRPAAAQKMEAALTEDGKLTGFYHKVATPSVIGFFNPLRWEVAEPLAVTSMRGAESKFYGIPDFRADHLIMERLSPFRGFGAAHTAFAAEAFMDELAEEAGRDLLAFLMDLMAGNPRGAHLLEKVAEMSGWNDRGNRALGLSIAGYSSSMAAGVAKVEADADSGEIGVTKFWTAIDARLIVSPDNALNQNEGGIIYGISMALTEKIDIENGEAVQENFYDHEITRTRQVPEIEIYLADVDAPPIGVGEVDTPMVSAAIACAFFAAKGQRLRNMPFTPDRVRNALTV